MDYPQFSEDTSSNLSFELPKCHYSSSVSPCIRDLGMINEAEVNQMFSTTGDFTIKEPLSPNFKESVGKGFKAFKDAGERVKGTSTGKWSLEEESRFLAFLKNNDERPVTIRPGPLEPNSKKIKRRRRKYFEDMAKFVKTRDANQCRSHEQKFRQNQLKRPSKGHIVSYYY